MRHICRATQAFIYHALPASRYAAAAYALCIACMQHYKEKSDEHLQRQPKAMPCREEHAMPCRARAHACCCSAHVGDMPQAKKPARQHIRHACRLFMPACHAMPCHAMPRHAPLTNENVDDAGWSRR